MNPLILDPIRRYGTLTFQVVSSTLETRQNRAVSVMKGCAWDDSPGFCRAAYRHTRPVESRHIFFGFRLVRVPLEDPV